MRKKGKTMIHKQEHSLNSEILEMLSKEGLDGMNQAVKILMNAAMLLEREKYLGAALHERTEERRGYANGFKPKTVQTRIGSLELEVPQTRDGQFYPNCLEKGLRSERALKLALAEMYVNGVSTRKVAKITEELCGFQVSSTQVSNASKLLDEELEKWRNRSLGSFPY